MNTLVGWVIHHPATLILIAVAAIAVAYVIRRRGSLFDQE